MLIYLVAPAFLTEGYDIMWRFKCCLERTVAGYGKMLYFTSMRLAIGKTLSVGLSWIVLGVMIWHHETLPRVDSNEGLDK